MEHVTKTKLSPEQTVLETVSAVTSGAVRSGWSLQGRCCCQSSILGHTLCASWDGSLGNEAAVGAGVRYTWSRQNM